MARKRTEAILVCGAAATSLSKIANQLHTAYGDIIIDVEDVIKRGVDWSRFEGSPHTMGTLCSELDRDEVLEEWKTAFRTGIAEATRPQKNAEGHAIVIATHLTLFSPTRLEYYLPPLAGVLAASLKKLQISRVIVLIDDVYDMFHRLSADGDMCNEDSLVREHRHHSELLTGGPVLDTNGERRLVPSDGGIEVERHPDPFSAEDSENLRIEAIAKSLIRLMTWRKTEMMEAEHLARNLSTLYGRRVPLSVLGTKHQLAALQSLIEGGRKAIYISHKITEPREENRALAAKGLHSWPDYAVEVNSLAESLLNEKIIGIQPTAIDELRFFRNSLATRRIERYSLNQSDRWPLLSGIMYSAVASKPDVLDIAELSEYSSGTAGMLQHAIYDEIAFRDHLLVSCNDGILVFRPGAFGAKISGGVEMEIAHWAKSSLGSDAGQRPLAIIHLSSELTELIGRYRFLSETVRLGFYDGLRGSYSAAQKDSAWEALLNGSDGAPASESSLHLLRAQPGIESDRMTSAAYHAAASVLGAACNVDLAAADRVAHFVADSESEAVSTDFVRSVALYLNSPSSQARFEANRLAALAYAGHSGFSSVQAWLRNLATEPHRPQE